MATNTDQAALRLSDVSVRRDKQCVLSDVDLSLSRGELLILLGPNGVGKTTLLDCASGEIQPASGEVVLNNQRILDIPLATKACKLAVLPQQSALQFPFSVAEVVSLGRFPHSSGSVCDNAILAAVSDALDITALLKRRYTQLSGGEKQRVQLARVICQVSVSAELDVVDGGVLLLDEPLSALDLQHQTRVMDLIKRLNGNGLSVLAVLHDINLAASYANKIAYLESGRLVACDSPENMVTPAFISQIYGIDVSVIEHPVTAKPLVIR